MNRLVASSHGPALAVAQAKPSLVLQSRRVIMVAHRSAGWASAMTASLKSTISQPIDAAASRQKEKYT